MSATYDVDRFTRSEQLRSMVRLAFAVTMLFVSIYWTTSTAKASEITITNTVPLTRTPWVRSLTVPQFDPAVGALQRVRLSFKVTLRGEGYYENRSNVTSTISFEHAGEIAFNFDNGDEISTLNTVAKSHLDVRAYDGFGGFTIIGPLPQNDEERLKTLFNGTSGGKSVATNATNASFIYTKTNDLQRFLGTGEIGVDVFADAESKANDTTGNVDYEMRAAVDAQLVVVYQYVTTDIQLEKTVYQGHNNGAGCPGVEKVEAEQGTPITYCFKVINTGETFLNNITISDTTLGISEQQMKILSGTEPLAPKASMVFYVQRTLDKQLINQAKVEGTPTDAGGTRVQGLDKPTDEDVAQVSLSPRASDETDEPTPNKRIFLPLVTR